MADIEIPAFAVKGPPRTKKTSNRIVVIRPKDRPEFRKVMPSAAHEKWFKLAMQQAPIIKLGLKAAGIDLPIHGDLNVCALFYRQADVGDAAGYYQSLGDYLQMPLENAEGKETRKGAGVIVDDRQIRRWWGSDLLVDKVNPRIEVFISVFRERPITREMFQEEEF